VVRGGKFQESSGTKGSQKKRNCRDFFMQLEQIHSWKREQGGMGRGGSKATGNASTVKYFVICLVGRGVCRNGGPRIYCRRGEDGYKGIWQKELGAECGRMSREGGFNTCLDGNAARF